MEQEINRIESRKKQNRKVTIFAIILSLVSIGLLVVGFLLVSSDKVVMLQSISNLTTKFEKVLDSDSELLDKIATSKDLGMKASVNLTSDYINAGLTLNYLENKDDKKTKINLGLTLNDESTLDIEGVLANDKMYLFADDITPRYYYTALEYVTILSSLKGSDYDKLTSLLKDAITDNIDNEEIKKEKVEITYNGKSKKVNKLSYAITNEKIKNMITNFVDSLKKDKELLNNIANYLNVTSEEIVSNLDNFLNELTYEEVKTGCYYNVYYYGFNKIVGYELADKDNNPVIEYKVQDTETINIYSDKIKTMSLEIKKNKESYTFNGFVKDTEEDTDMPFIGIIKGDTMIITINEEDVDIKLAITSTEEIKENNYISTNKIVLSGITEGEEVTVGTLDLNLEYYFGEKVNADISNSVDVNEITEKDLETIQNNLITHPIYQLIMGISGTLELSL